MSFKKIFFHFIGSVGKSIFILIITLALIVLSAIYAVVSVDSQVQLNLFTLIIGITSGFIVSLITVVLNRFTNSLNAYNGALRIVEEATIYITSANYALNSNVYFDLFHFYNQIILLSGSISYKKDYNEISKNFYKMLAFVREKAINEDQDNANLTNEQNELKNLMEILLPK